MTDQEVVGKARAGDLDAFRRIVDEHKLTVYRIAFDMTGNRHDAEDISQDVFIKVYRSLDRFRGDAKLSTWIYRIAVNTCYDYRSKKSWSSMKPQENMDEEGKDPMFHGHASQNPERAAEAQVIQGHIERALDRLTPRERSIFVLRHYNNLSQKEIAMVLKISEGTVKSLLFRALRRLQRELRFYRGELGLEESK